MNININISGDLWTALGTIATFLAVFVALIPFYKENLLINKRNYIIRSKLIMELENIHESYYGKIYDYIQYNKTCTAYIIPENDYGYFNTLELMMNDILFLKNNEKNKIIELIKIHKYCLYRKNHKGQSKISLIDIKNIEFISITLLNLLQKSKMSIVHRKEYIDYRNKAYIKITNIFNINNSIIVNKQSRIDMMLIIIK